MKSRWQTLFCIGIRITVAALMQEVPWSRQQLWYKSQWKRLFSLSVKLTLVQWDYITMEYFSVSSVLSTWRQFSNHLCV